MSVSAFSCFDAIYCIQNDNVAERRSKLSARWERMGLAGQVQDFDAIITPGNLAVGKVLTHRHIIERASQQGLQSVLVFEQDLLWLDTALPVLEAALPELAAIEWEIACLGGLCWDADLAALPQQPVGGATGPTHWRPVAEFSCTHAVAYRASAYARLLQELPSGFGGFDQWLATHHDLERYQRRLEGMVELTTHVASLPYLLPYESSALQFHFTA